MRKRSLCLIDDEESELHRARANLSEHFRVGVGATIAKAISDLGSGKPDLFLLDMYYGPTTSQEQRELVAAGRRRFLEAQAEFRSTLEACGQSAEGGLSLADDIRRDYAGVPFAFFTRKGTLEDAVKAFDKGADAVLKKPDPDTSDLSGRCLDDAYDVAFARRKNEIFIQLERLIARNTLWAKHKAWAQGFIMGFFFLILKILWDHLTR
jgi:CheY-like chemotaxis protein